MAMPAYEPPNDPQVAITDVADGFTGAIDTASFR